MWQSLIANTDVQKSPVRIIIAGRKNILKSEPWRKLNQDRNCIYDLSLDRFDEQQTQEYLYAIGIEDNELVTQIFQATKGLPYYLNKIHERREKDQEIDYSQLNEEIVSLLLQGINKTQKTVIQLASCSRWFDKSLIKFFLKHNEELDFKTAVDVQLNCFEWLKQLDFVEYVQGFYRLDDVARDVFRESLYRNDKDLFKQTHKNLATYFHQLAEDEADDYNPREQYENSAWCQAISDYLYHSLCGNSDHCKEELISYLFTSHYFNQDAIVKIPVETILEENSQQLFLKQKNYNFINKILPVVSYDQWLLDVDEIDYESFNQEIGLEKSQIDSALQKCFTCLNKLTGLAKFLALFYKSKRSYQYQRLNLLNQAYQQAASITSNCHPEFSSRIFLWTLGEEFYNLAKYEEVIEFCNKALEIKPDLEEAWFNRGFVLEQLGRYEEAIKSYDKAIKINPDKDNAWYNRGVVLGNLGRYEEAITSYDKVIEINLNDDSAWNNRGSALGNLGRYEEAIASYDKAIKINPDKDNA